MRSRYFKTALERLLAHAGPLQVSRRLSRSTGTILAYHNIVPDAAGAAGDTSLHLPRRQFGEQLDMLVQTHDVVALESVLDVTGTPAHRPQVAITFDDAYRGAVTQGVEELATRGLPATIFVAPCLLGRQSFWWDDLVRRGDTELPQPVRQRLLNELRGDDARIRAWAAEVGLSLDPESHRAGPATEEQLRSAVDIPGITVASHSLSHRNLVRLSERELREELESSLAWLQERFDRVLPWLSYPYGLSSPSVEAQVRAAGYRAAVRNGGGMLPTRLSNRFGLPRLNVPAGLSLDGFALRIAGLSFG